MKVRYLYMTFILLFSCTFNNSDFYREYENRLEISSKNRDARIEVGGPFAGVEFHHSSPLINRISFFYPVANSIDRSRDYWSRDTVRIFFIGLKRGGEEKRLIGLEPFNFNLTPYSVEFFKDIGGESLSVNYEFCKDKPAFLLTLEVFNNSGKGDTFELYTHLDLTLRTSHTYEFKRKAWSEHDSDLGALIYNFDDNALGNVRIFTINTGENPVSFTTSSQTSDLPGSGNNWWLNYDKPLPCDIMKKNGQGHPVAGFLYRKYLEPGQKMIVRQIIGTSISENLAMNMQYLKENYSREVKKYREEILSNIFEKEIFRVSDSFLQHSVDWSRAILLVNAHYLDGDIVPMPCPAQYNFYFTHDVLLTDLSAVNFNIDRVKGDLLYILEHADSTHRIPHAYYWKDDRYVTEYAGSDNWNHLWFIILSSRYLRHSGDRRTVEELYPCLEKSIGEILKNRGKDNLIWNHQPDWWDIGDNYGPRAYLSILTVRALRNFTYISAALSRNTDSLKKFIAISEEIESAINEKLWDGELNYLISYLEDGSKDRHIYTGSLLASHFDILTPERREKLVKTAENKLLDEKIGVYNVYPVDFHDLIDRYNFHGNEAGDPYYYLNGGIWPHGNAWFALSLISAGKNLQSFEFVKNTMTLDGIMNSPKGQPAMYEYRVSDFRNPDIYGRVDKPQFLWAGGFFLYTLYYLGGLRENVWNLSLSPLSGIPEDEFEYSLFADGREIRVISRGNDKKIKYIKYNRTDYPSLVLPDGHSSLEQVDLQSGDPEYPYLIKTESILSSASWNKEKKELRIIIKAFKGHKNRTVVIAPEKPVLIQINGRDYGKEIVREGINGIYRVEINFIHRDIEDTLLMRF